jgi:predicted PurR-regulated permease PerM
MPEVVVTTQDADVHVRLGLRVAAAYAWRIIVVAGLVYLIFVMLGRLQFVAVAVFVGLVISALLRPVVDVLSRGMPRAAAVAITLISGILLVVGVFTFIGRSVAGESSNLINKFSGGVNDIENWLRTGPLHLTATEISKYADQARVWIEEHRGQFASQALGGATVAFELLTGLALAIFLSIFFLHHGDRMWEWFIGQTPQEYRDRLDRAARAGWNTFAGYTRGIVIIAATNATLVCLALLIMRVPLALPLTLLVFFASFIPLIGSPLALAVATVVALAARGPWIALSVLVLIVVIGQIEGHVLHPIVMSRAVSIHPVVVALAVASGSLLGGVIGAVVAVPIVAVTWSVTQQFRVYPSKTQPLEEGEAAPDRPPGVEPEVAPEVDAEVVDADVDDATLAEGQRPRSHR